MNFITTPLGLTWEFLLQLFARLRKNSLSILRLMRVHQWVKNILILVPVVFSGHIHNADLLVRSLEAVFLFSLLASSVYILNDAIDAPLDRKHPKKRHR